MSKKKVRPAENVKVFPGEKLMAQWRGRYQDGVVPPLVRVIWVDAVSFSGSLMPNAGWERKYKDGIVQQSVGHKLKYDKKFITIAMDVCAETGLCRDIMDIPSYAVLEVKELK